MTQTYQAAIDLFPLDLSDWRKRIHQLKKELRDDAPNQTPLPPIHPLPYGSKPSPMPAVR